MQKTMNKLHQSITVFNSFRSFMNPKTSNGLFNWSLAFVLGIVLSFLTDGIASAQSVCLPLPRLLTTMPMGGKVGTQVEITITGESIEGASELYFTHPSITAVPKADANGKPITNQYVVTIGSDCPLGIHEARIMTRLGISSSRVFSVGNLPEVIQSAPNTSLTTAMELKVNSVCNAITTNKAIDFYSFQAVKGHRYAINCDAKGIDSKLDAVLILADESGSDLIAERRGGVLTFTAEKDGTHTIKIHELTYKGGREFFYRLSLIELSADAPVPQFASTRSVSCFSWPPVGLASEPASLEGPETRAKDQVQTITLPCDIGGSFFPAADVDTFEFQGVKGDSWWVEIASERLGRATDPTAVVQYITGEGSDQKITDVVEFSDIPSPMKPSTNNYAYDGPPYNGGSLDFIGKLDIKEDGRYRIQISDLFGGTRNDPKNIYRLVIRKAAPDFALAAWGLHMELRNGDRNALSKPLALRAGSTVALEVVAVRRDGFDGDIQLVMDGLPPGVTAQGLKIPAGKSRGIMLVSANAQSQNAFSNATLVGTSTIDNATVTRPVQIASMAWPIPDAWNDRPNPRLISGLPVSVTNAELSPITLVANEQKTYEVTAGEKLTVPLTCTCRCDFSGDILQLKVSGEGFEATPRFDLNLKAQSGEVVFNLATLKTPPGDYLVSLYGGAVAKYRYYPELVGVAEAELKQAEESLASIVAEAQRLTDIASATPDEKKADANKAVSDQNEKKKSAEGALKEATARLKVARDQSAPKDTVDIVMSEPIAIRVKPAEAK